MINRVNGFSPATLQQLPILQALCLSCLKGNTLLLRTYFENSNQFQRLKILFCGTVFLFNFNPTLKQ
jgi:hypothetical protein